MSAREREQVWRACVSDGKVFCVHCGGEVHKDKPWDVCHIGVPAAHDGMEVGIGHRACNARDNIEFVRPLVERTKRLYRRHHGINGPGLGADAMPAGRRSNVSKTIKGKVVPRLTQAQKHRQTMAALYPFGRPK